MRSLKIVHVGAGNLEEEILRQLAEASAKGVIIVLDSTNELEMVELRKKEITINAHRLAPRIEIYTDVHSFRDKQPWREKHKRKRK